MKKETHITTNSTHLIHEISDHFEILLHAQPYDISANGFYFRSFEEYQQKSSALRNDYGDLVEEFEIQFIDGDDLDCDLFKALDIHQGNFDAFFTACEGWDEDQKIKVIIAVGEAGYSFDLHKDDPDDFDIDLYEMDSLRDLAEQFIEEGLFGEIPENIRFYLDYDAIARDLGMDYNEITLAGRRYIYRCP
ncbi:MAG: antirestriction protein ArdA [Alphaproteobacteria bacterium CG_4_9_14_3_um_filter_47_13]|nr:MAG: antirestriction protein ArdA [Alphaproteobacteria bacterium CG_4_9_14_3_um_filter_47_13]